ncbi:2-dehydropantoate 2-reductase [Flavobacterium sp. CG_23.5]|uniref:2-dehydropantoate 2-reductase n=1 Tax=Flavobacterium sp. CG_23.5 TaxID=2760708 RepID=UPI001AE2650D|nr:2-dehydropantoate 2-reductase [Flavobacterium sp. CG_23.5]MBP2284847.1 2-dehydropantoate 2-reductase [Flavobacterium sp. CG_23.5]
MLNKSEIINNLNTAHSVFWETAIQLPNPTISINHKWSVSQNVEHITIALLRLSNYLALPKSSIQSNFGFSERASINYEKSIMMYKNALEDGVKATGAFIPKIHLETNIEELVSQGKNALAVLILNLKYWSEEELEMYNCPHPILGKITVREILYFTNYHVQHHNQTIKNKPMKQVNKTRIAIAGIGGIGGFIGGKLAHYYSNIENIDIVFITRGENYEVINKKGLRLLSNDFLYKCVPTLTSNNPVEIGTIDIFIICTKNFSVTDVLQEYANCLTPNTTIITTQNTVNGKESITPYLPKGATLMEGSIYIASNSIKPGKIEHVSGPAKFIFGTDGENSKGENIAMIFNNAGIDATYTTNVKTVIWKKFMFVSPAAIVTALFQITFSEILENTKSEYLFINLISELMQLARAKNITIDDNTILNNITLLGNFNGHVKSSFQLDLEKSKPTEINSLVKYIIDEAKLFQISTPHFDSAINQLKKEYKVLAQ